MSPETDVGGLRSRLIPYKWELLVLLWVAFTFNQADRQIYNNLLPQIQPDLQLSNEQAGLVATVFTAIYGILVPVSGYVGDVFRRKWVIIGALTLWSTATLLTGLAGGIIGLIVFRGLATGAGEAFYYPSANSLIGQLHQRTRALAMGIHQTANYIGVALSFIGAYVGERLRLAQRLLPVRRSRGSSGRCGWSFGWKTRPSPATAPTPRDARRCGEVLRYIAGKPTVMCLAVSFACHVFANIGYLTWMPTFLHEKFDLSLTAASFWALSVHYAASAMGVLARRPPFRSAGDSPPRGPHGVRVDRPAVQRPVPDLDGPRQHPGALPDGLGTLRPLPRRLRLEPVRRAVRRHGAALSVVDGRFRLELRFHHRRRPRPTCWAR